MAKKNTKQKLAFPIGLIVVLLAAIGLATVVVAGVKGVGTAIDKSRHFEEYEKYFTPVVLIDPDTFDDITKADMSQLMEISLWSLLKSDVDPNSFESNDNGLAIPKSAVEKEFVETLQSQTYTKDEVVADDVNCIINGSYDKQKLAIKHEKIK